MHRCRPWADLPIDILSSIADRLGIIELLSFRGTCKGFRSASPTASAEIESSRTPWLLFVERSSSNCIIYNPHESKTYNKNIPELEDATFLASYQGWLLLFKQQSIIFFNPFSGAKIVLPRCLYDISNFFCIGAFSHLPTSPHCIVSIMNFAGEVFVISKGESEWTYHKVPKDIRLRCTIFSATFDHKSQTFYYMSSSYSGLIFSVKDKKKWKRYDICNRLPYFNVWDAVDQMTRKKKESFDFNISVKDIHVCGITFHEPVTSGQYVYSDEIANVFPTKKCVEAAVWIQPRFFEADTNQHW